MPETCAQCNNSLNPNDEFCGHCGHARPNDASPAEAPAWTPPTRTPHPQAAAVTRRNIVYNDEMDSRSTFDPLKNGRFLRQLAFRLVIYTGVTGFIDTVILVLALFTSGFGAIGVMKIVGPLSWLILVALFWLLPVPALIGQRTQLLTDRAPAGPRAFEYIRHSFDEHATPRDSLRVRKITPPGQDRRDYLELRDGLFTGYVSCFQHGKDLYIGWTFWLRVSPIRVALMRLARNVQNYSGRGGDIYQTFRWESAKASVGAIQACMLDGIEAAINDMDGTTGVPLPASSDSIMATITQPQAPTPGSAAGTPWPTSPAGLGAEIARQAVTKATS
jgi:hypothetical protein